MSSSPLYLNMRFFKYDDNELEVIRIVRFYNTSTIKYQVIRGKRINETRKMLIDELWDTYTLLVVDGIISISAVSLQNINDVMIMLMRKKDIDKGISTPYAVCRQCVSDIFHYVYAQDGKDYYGMSISVDSCPANVDFSNFLACEKVISKPINIAYYLGDKLFDILDQINTKPFDDVLTELFQQHCNFASNGIPFIKQDMLNRQSVDGYVKTLKDLVTFNNFEYDISTAFDIIPINADLSNCTGQELDPTTKKELGFILAQNICRSLVLLYDKDIDLNKLQHRLYKLVSDTNNDLYIVVYDIFGEYHVPVEESETPDNIIKLNNVVDAKSVKEAYAYIRLNTSKYNS